MKINVVFKRVDKNFLEKNFNSIMDNLHVARREKVANFRNKAAAYVSMTAGLLLQEVVESEVGLKPQDIIIAKNENGKPYLKDYPEYKYNISHSGDMVMLAYSTQELGVDIEEIRHKDIEVATRCFCPSEYEYVLNGINEEEEAVDQETEYEEEIENTEYEAQDENALKEKTEYEKEMEVCRRFFEIWTLKESYLKLIGKGISVPLYSFVVDIKNKCVKNENLKYYIGAMDNYVYSICAADVSDVSIQYL